MGAHLRFDVHWPDGKKTAVVDVCSLAHGDLLGHIKWFGRWRQYAFFPAADTIWNPDCLDAVNAQIRRLMEQRSARGS